VTILDRRAARVVLVDRANRTLLLRGGDPARPALRWWFTPGGGLNDGETPAEGAARELFEETGLRVEPASLGEPVWHQVTHFSYDNRRYRQEQDFYLFRVPEWQVDTAGLDAEEKLTIDAHRWWSAEELDATDETVFPEDLPDLLRRCTAPPPAAVPVAASEPSSAPVAGSEPSSVPLAAASGDALGDSGVNGASERGR
jgi:8-oxo-dGTP pyrophosphatase MutT (NUDIX family)